MSKNKDVNIRVLGNKGQALTPDMFKQEIKKSDLNDPNQIEIFNKYNRNGDDKLDEKEMQSLFADMKKSSQNIDTSKNVKSLKREDIKGSDCGRIFDEIDNSDGKQDKILKGSQIQEFYSKVQTKNKTLEPMEIQKLIQSKGLSKKVKVGDVLNFLDKVAVKSHVKKLNDFTLNKDAKNELGSIHEQNVADVLTSYKKEHGESIIQHIANRRWALGGKRENYINIVKNKLISQAQLYGIDTKNFNKEFDKELKNMDLTFFFKEDTSKLDKLVDDMVKKINAKQKTYTANRGSIADMMTNPEECRTDDDKYEIINDIIKFSNKNDPKKLLTNIVKESKDPKVKKSAQMLLKSKMITDYFPTFVASIIAQESQFRGTDDAVYTPNGQGIMQLTKFGIQNIYDNNKNYESSFVDNLKKRHKTADSLYSAIKDDKNVELNLTVGSGMLTGLVNTVLKRMKNDSIPKSINMNSPEAVMQFVAMSYNGNNAAKKDTKYDGKMSQVRYIYGRDVIQRFQKHAPKDAKVTKYFEYNPNTDDFTNRKFSS